jgi:CAAX protease family protein
MSDWVPPSGAAGEPPPDEQRPPAGPPAPVPAPAYGAPVPLPPPPGYPAPPGGPQQPYPHQPYPQQGYPPPYPGPYGTGYQPAYGPPPPGGRAAPARQPQEASTEPLEYHEVLRGGREGWWWALLGLPVVAIAFLVAQLAIMVPFVVVAVADGEDVMTAVEGLADFTDPTPSAMIFLLLNLAVLIPIVWLTVRVVHDLKPGWTSSVRPRIRWSYFGVCLVLALVALMASLGVSVLLQGSGEATGGEVIQEFDSRTRDLALVILLLTPFQAAGEEYGFRGYLTQAFGALFAFLGPIGARILAVLAPATLFALAHGSQSVPVFFDRFAFGVVAGVLVIVTGGLEAGIAMHVLNNYLAFGAALATGTLAESLQPTGGSWSMIPATLTQSLVYLALAWFVARKMGMSNRTDPAVLAASRGLVYRGPSVPPAAVRQ